MLPVTVMVEVALLPGTTWLLIGLAIREKLPVAVVPLTVSVNADDVLAW